MSAARRSRPGLLPVFDDQICSANFVMLVPHQFEVAARLGVMMEPYSWGHCGPLYLDGRIVILQATLGL